VIILPDRNAPVGKYLLPMRRRGTTDDGDPEVHRFLSPDDARAVA